ncbi:hypothetical protein DFH11DRAFT_1625225, partial [Phellopilus nigrolimitatus]
MSSSSSPDSLPFVSTICTAVFSAFASGVYVTLACLVCLDLYLFPRLCCLHLLNTEFFRDFLFPYPFITFFPLCYLDFCFR